MFFEKKSKSMDQWNEEIVSDEDSRVQMQNDHQSEYEIKQRPEIFSKKDILISVKDDIEKFAEEIHKNIEQNEFHYQRIYSIYRAD